MMVDLSEQRERLWVPLAAPVIWALHFTLCYITVALWCGRFITAGSWGGLPTVVTVYTAVAMAGIGVFFIHGLRRHRYELPNKTHDDDTPEDRHHFIAWTTMLLAGLSFLGTGFVALAVTIVGGCS
jgi:hypothetical protein